MGIFESVGHGPKLPQLLEPADSLSSSVRWLPTREKLKAAPRTDFGSRTSRRLRRDGLVPGVVYTGGSDARAFQVPARDVRTSSLSGAALFDLEVEGTKAVPVVVKEQQLHPVRGNLEHIDLQEVQARRGDPGRGRDRARGRRGRPWSESRRRARARHPRDHGRGAADRDPRTACSPTSPAMEINDTLQLSSVPTPTASHFIAEDLDEVTIATLSPPRVEEEPEPEVEEETELVGEEGEAAQAEGDGDSGGDGDSRRLRRGVTPVHPPAAGGTVRGEGEQRRPDPDRRPGQPGPGVRRHPAQRRLRGRAPSSPRRWDLPRARKKLQRAARRRPKRPRRAAGRGPAAADLHERLRRLGRAGAGLAQGAARPARRRPRRDRPALRRDPGPRSVAASPATTGSRASSAGSASAEFWRVRVGVGRPDSTDPEIVSSYVLSALPRAPGRRR